MRTSAHVCIQRVGFGVVCAIILGVLIGWGFFAKWTFYDAPGHVKKTECIFDRCNVTSGKCNQAYREFDCYKYIVIFSASIDGRIYTKEYQNTFDFSGKYPTICSKNHSGCDYIDT